jgi:hypothetical protein
MTGRELIAQILDNPAALGAQVFATDQYGAEESPVVDVRMMTGRLLLAILVCEPEEPDEERVQTRHSEPL